MTKELQLYQMGLAPVGSVEAYVHNVGLVPVLSAEEEFELARLYQEEGDLEAAKTLVLSQLRYVVRVAKGYMGYGLPLTDLIQEGNIGLMKAVKRFDPKVGVRLVSFAVHWIKAEIHEYIIRNWRIVKIATTKAQRKLFFNLRKTKKHLGWMNPSEVADLAADLDVSPADVEQMEARMNHSDLSLEYHADDQDEEEQHFSPIQYLEDKQADPYHQLADTDASELNKERLLNALESLDERSRHILNLRWLNDTKVTLQDLAEKYNISLERVRQIEKNAMNKLKAALVDLS